jgi:hypothetical protein
MAKHSHDLHGELAISAEVVQERRGVEDLHASESTVGRGALNAPASGALASAPRGRSARLDDPRLGPYCDA